MFWFWFLAFFLNFEFKLHPEPINACDVPRGPSTVPCSTLRVSFLSGVPQRAPRGSRSSADRLQLGWEIGVSHGCSHRAALRRSKPSNHLGRLRRHRAPFPDTLGLVGFVDNVGKMLRRGAVPSSGNSIAARSQSQTVKTALRLFKGGWLMCWEMASTCPSYTPSWRCVFVSVCSFGRVYSSFC